jgi:hypothetical protein
MDVTIYHSNSAGRDAFQREGDSWFYDINSLAFSVADAPLRVLTREIRKYPQEDYGFEASDIFCKTTVKELKHSTDIKSAQLKANEQIRKYAETVGRSPDDPVYYDCPECVGMTVKIEGNTLYWGGVEDCYVHVLDSKSLENKINIKNEISKAYKAADPIVEKNQIKKFVDKKLLKILPKRWHREALWAGYQRNNTEAKNDDGESLGWGCFSGEKGVETFIQTGSVKIEKGDHIFLISDGMIPVLEDKNLIRWFIDNAKPSYYFDGKFRHKIMYALQKYEGEEAHKRYVEGTLLYFKWDK